MLCYMLDINIYIYIYIGFKSKRVMWRGEPITPAVRPLFSGCALEGQIADA